VRPFRFFSIGIEGRADLPASSSPTSAGAVETYVIAGSVVPCVRTPWPVFACGFVSAGDFHETGLVSVPQSNEAVYLAAGPRVGAEVHVVGPVYALGSADAAFTLVRHSVTLAGSDTPLFVLPIVAPSINVGAAAVF
jgi:hypothetical protein